MLKVLGSPASVQGKFFQGTDLPAGHQTADVEIVYPEQDGAPELKSVLRILVDGTEAPESPYVCPLTPSATQPCGKTIYPDGSVDDKTL